MESKRDYSDAGARELSLPREVYYRCLWTVRDAARLALTARAAGNISEDAFGSGIMRIVRLKEQTKKGSDEPAVLVSEETAMQAMHDLRCIERAIDSIPDDYREGIIDNIMLKRDYPDFAHPNTWKKWRLAFLSELARELHLI